MKTTTKTAKPAAQSTTRQPEIRVIAGRACAQAPGGHWVGIE